MRKKRNNTIFNVEKNPIREKLWDQFQIISLSMKDKYNDSCVPNNFNISKIVRKLSSTCTFPN